MVVRVEVVEPNLGWQLTRSLEADVYPPSVMERVPWRSVVWAYADKRVIVWPEGDSSPAAHAAIYLRQGLGDGRRLRIGGIGGVMTHTSRQGQGFASAAMREAQRVLRQECKVDIGLLFCESYLVAFYKKLGWKAFRGSVIVDQPGGRKSFDVLRAMTFDVLASPPAREIDACGLPW